MLAVDRRIKKHPVRFDGAQIETENGHDSAVTKSLFDQSGSGVTTTASMVISPSMSAMMMMMMAIATSV